MFYLGRGRRRKRLSSCCCIVLGEMKKECDLCRRRPASMYCDSDQASLCFHCDANVHAANFLVARHTRTLLCHACHSPTPWTASGLNLGAALSFCRRCSPAGAKVGDQSTHQVGDGGDEFEEDGYADGDDEEEEEEEEEEEDGDNQVVPWSAGSCSSSNSEGGSFQRYSSENSMTSSAKRLREIEEVAGRNELEYASSLQPDSIADDDETTSVGLCPHKRAFLHRPVVTSTVLPHQPNLRKFSGRPN